jgi:hypothetical protein
MSTYTDQLASVRAAISALEAGGQEVRMADGRTVRYPDLAVLYAREERLVPLATREASGRTGPSISRGAGL